MALRLIIGGEIVPLGSNVANRVGFRSGDGEHEHFRKVNVKPL